jgi:hypothetical protein
VMARWQHLRVEEVWGVQVGCVLLLMVVARERQVDQGPADRCLRQRFRSATRDDPKVMLLRCSAPRVLLLAHIARQHRLQNPGVLLLMGLAWKLDGLRSLELQHCRGALLPLIGLAGLAALLGLLALLAMLDLLGDEISKQEEWQHSRCAAV